MCGFSGTVTVILNQNLGKLRNLSILPQRITLQSTENQAALSLKLTHVLNCAGALAHQQKKLIGDIRPHNIMISEDGEIQVISLATFPDEDTNYVYKGKNLPISRTDSLSPKWEG